MAAKRGLECKICRCGWGVCQPGFRKTHVREDPECRLHGQLGRCTRPAQPLLPAPPTPAAAESYPGPDRKTQFATPGGLHLLYDPEARDRWIPRKVEDNDTGEMLSQDDEADFVHYQQRLCDRYRVREMADRLVLQIVDRYMPRVAYENRAYVMRYPDQVQTMLKNAWKIRKRIRANQKQERKRRKKADASASPKHDDRAKQQAVEGERMQNMEGERPAVHARKEESLSEDTPPDWGSDDDPPDSGGGRH